VQNVHLVCRTGATNNSADRLSANLAFQVQLLHLGSGEFPLLTLWISGFSLETAGVLSWTISCYRA
jgi:hypothetical protein